MVHGFRPLIAAAVLCVAGCATLQDPQRANLAAPADDVAGCASWYRSLDRQIDAAGVHDAGAWRVPGFPYLRADRFTASFADRAAADAGVFPDWVARMRELDALGRIAELENLPQAALDALGVGHAGAVERTAACARTLADHDLGPDPRRALLAERARVPDSYRTWQRALGLYPLTSLPFGAGVRDWQRETAESFRALAESGFDAPAVRYLPEGAPDRQAAREILAVAPRDALGIARLSVQELDVLFAAHAPAIEVETTGDYDRIGRLAWDGSAAPSIDPSRPTLYRQLAHTRFHGETLLQLVYTAWFSERPHDSRFDLLAGRLDGIVWRVTLDRTGEPLLYDTIHPCGCFHMFFPAARMQPVPAPERNIEWAFVPAPAPRLAEGERVVIRLATRTHYLHGVGADAGSAGEPLGFADYDALRALPLPDGGSRSAFAPDGLVPGTVRGERVFFWPMGVPSAGAMRQWGHHATAFVGRRHFDDADLIERRFELLPE